MLLYCISLISLFSRRKTSEAEPAKSRHYGGHPESPEHSSSIPANGRKRQQHRERRPATAADAQGGLHESAQLAVKRQTELGPVRSKSVFSDRESGESNTAHDPRGGRWPE